MTAEHHQRTVLLMGTTWASVFKISSSLLLLTIILSTIANPYSPRARVKQTLASQKDSHPRIPAHVKLRSLNQNKTNSELSATTKKWLASTKFPLDNIDLHLPRFPTLQSALDNSEVVVLYFAASWCKSSKPVTAMIDRTLGEKLKSYSKLKRKPLSLIYVSSDTSKVQYKSYNRNRFWAKVPFKSSERRGLKKYFKVCAKRELEKLQYISKSAPNENWKREHELPYMVVLSGGTHKVVSNTGVEDMEKLGPGTLEYWKSLVRGEPLGFSAKAHIDMYN